MNEYSEALVEIAGEAGDMATISSFGLGSSRGHASLNTSITVMYHVTSQHHGGFIIFIADDWLLAENMCLTVYAPVAPAFIHLKRPVRVPGLYDTLRFLAVCRKRRRNQVLPGSS